MRFLKPVSNVTAAALCLAGLTACASKPAEPAAPASAAAAGLVASHGAAGQAGPVAQAAAPAAQAAAPLAPSSGTFTVAKVVADRTALAGKTVTISGKVVKYNGGILGLNWLHVQDGSGAEKDGTNDIAVTSVDVAKVGDMVTITGTVVIDKDFGAGYNYAVLLQNASIAVK